MMIYQKKWNIYLHISILFDFKIAIMISQYAHTNSNGYFVPKTKSYMMVLKISDTQIQMINKFVNIAFTAPN